LVADFLYFITAFLLPSGNILPIIQQPINGEYRMDALAHATIAAIWKMFPHAVEVNFDREICSRHDGQSVIYSALIAIPHREAVAASGSTVEEMMAV
jgi:hypothetical protein